MVEKTTKKVRESMKEDKVREKKKNKMVMYNIAESNKEESEDRIKEDKEKCKEIIEGILGVRDSDIQQVIRLGKKQENTSRPRPLLIKLKEEKIKHLVLKRAKKLKDEREEKYRKVFINRDMTPQEMEEEKKLVEELKTRRRNGEEGWFIKNGKLQREERQRS